ncbi:DUF4232 domain-containing protein [Streptomyces sp. NPDC059740]|uniref:DUF4232 domain-containing protein n=1 Tax=Streptomyces sp. NPDC059740 TaxID=3346926 RepID=UPI00365BCA68
MTSRDRRTRTRPAALAALSAGLCATLVLTGCTHHTSRSRSHSTSSSKYRIGRHRTSTPATPTPSRTTSASSIGRCSLMRPYLSSVKGEDGDTRMLLTARNRSSRTCRLEWRPLLAFVKKGTPDSAPRHPLPAADVNKPFLGHGSVTVRPNSRAYAVFRVEPAGSTKGTLIDSAHYTAELDLGDRDDEMITHTKVDQNEFSFRVLGTPKLTWWTNSRYRALGYDLG